VHLEGGFCVEVGEVKKNGERSDGRYRLNSSYSEDEFDLIDKLAMGLGITPTRLQKEFMLLCLNNENIINFMQDKFKRRSRFRIIPSKVEGKMTYVLTEKKKLVSKKGN
jgi:hypothetical protein